MDKNMDNPTGQKATFAVGCFWGAQAYFKKIPGVLSTRAGYTGGTDTAPDYEKVCSGKTGHAESVEILFNPAQLPYARLLEHFWRVHNPTSRNKQGSDTGSQYRASIFYHTEEQKQLALASKQALEQSGKYNKPIATEIAPASTFYPAEEYHQDYLDKNPGGYCHITIKPD